MRRLVLLTLMGAAIGVGVGGAETLAIAAIVSRPSEAAPMILASSWAAAVIPFTYVRRPSSDALAARKWLVLSFVVPPVAAALVYALQRAS